MLAPIRYCYQSNGRPIMRLSSSASQCRIGTGTGSIALRAYSVNASDASRPRRAYLYVPSSNTRMLQKTLTSNSDSVVYDLEDGVAPSEKVGARNNLVQFLGKTSHDTGKLPGSERTFVRVNGIDTPYFHEDIAAVLQVSTVQSLVLPKIHSAADLDTVSQAISQSRAPRRLDKPINIVASIESARSLWALGEIASWKSLQGVAQVVALLFAAEDFCADTSIIRTSTRTELHYPRSKMALAAKAFQLQAIDMVCVNYKDKDYLREECEEGWRLGFDGKQAIHPDQVDIIQSTFVPTLKEIKRAATILHQMRLTYASSIGAFGLDMGDGKGSKEMIDAPMLKQAEGTIRLAKAAGLEIPNVE